MPPKKKSGGNNKPKSLSTTTTTHTTTSSSSSTTTPIPSSSVSNPSTSSPEPSSSTIPSSKLKSSTSNSLSSTSSAPRSSSSNTTHEQTLPSGLLRFPLNAPASTLAESVRKLTTDEGFYALASAPRTHMRQIRGLVNKGNTCYLNATLQALLALPPFTRLLRTLAGSASSPALTELPPITAALVGYALQHSMAETINALTSAPGSGRVGPPLTPGPILALLTNFVSSTSSAASGAIVGSGRSTGNVVLGRQQDAQEFLCWLLDSLHEELRQAASITSTSSAWSAVGSGDDWNEVGKNNKASIMRAGEFSVSPVTSAIFAGTLRSALKQAGAKPSVSVQPFYVLPVDILADDWGRTHPSIESALSAWASSNSITDTGASASQTLALEKLPEVLVLHLKRFAFDPMTGAMAKIDAPVSYPPKMELPEFLLSLGLRGSTARRKYTLVALVEHHGETLSNGHYTADTRNGDGSWAHCNDTSITAVSGQEVGTRKAYLLFYLRAHPASAK